MKRLVSGIMLTLILTSMLSMAFVIGPSSAESSKNSVVGEEGFDPEQRQVPSKGDEIFETRQGASLEKTLGSSGASSYDESKLNFNDTSQWGNFSYMDGNKTRLVVGIDSEDPTQISELENIAGRYQARIVNEVLMQGKVKALVFELLPVSVAGFSQEVHASELATYIEPNMKVQVQYVPDDPYWSMQWGPRKIEADWAWNTTIGDPSILVAVVDTGIFYPHPDLNANYVALGRDWANNDTDPLDDHGHGTHCAGIIAAILNNSEGIAGLAQARVMAEKVIDSYGWGYADWVANGIIHATDCGAKIISMSIGGWGDSELIHEAVKYAYDAGVLLVAAAGNENTNLKLYPAGYGEVISVAATDEYDDTAYFSNWGDWIELAAPGVNIYSTVPGGYTSMSGTSMACPHVAGVAALAWSQYPGSTRDWVRMWLRYGADDLGAEGFDVRYGYGRVNSRKAVQLSPPTHELIAFSWKTPPYVKPGTSAIVNATLLNFGNDETDVRLQLLANDTVVDSVVIDFLPGGDSVQVTFAWLPVIEGLYHLAFYVIPVLGEVNLENNVLSRNLFVGFPVKAVVLHSAGNVDSGIIANWQTLSDEWYLFGDTMVCIDYTTLSKEEITYADIAATGADVLIISCAYDPYFGWQFSDSEIKAIEHYVYEGHGLIATAGTFYEEAPNNNKLASLFGMNETILWGSTGTDLLHLLNTTHPLFARVPNPLVFPQVGTALPNDGRWDSNELVGGKYLGLGHYQESAIVTFRGLVYISPWLEVIPPYYHHHLQLFYNAIMWSRYQKPQHELVVSLQCPIHLHPGESVLVNVTVENLGLNNETNVQVFLQIDGIQVAYLTAPTLAVGELETLSHLWTPAIGTYNVTAYTPPVRNEEETSNNVKTVILKDSYAAVIGFIETHGESLHSDELKDFYEGLGHVVNTIHDSLTAESLAPYEVLIVGEDWYDNPWSPSEIAAVQDFIRSGKGFVAVGDELAPSVQEILREYGLSYTGDYGYPGSSNNLDHSHPVMQGVNYLYAPYPVDSLQADPPGYWIANDAQNTHMLIAGAEGEGYVLGMSDDFAAELYSDDNAIMFANVIDWKIVKYEHDLAVSLVVPASLELGNTALLNATVRNRGLDNETGVELYLLINSSVVGSATNLTLLAGKSYTVNFLWDPTETGNYNITAYAPPTLGEEDLLNNVKTNTAQVWFYGRLYLPNEWIGGGDPMGWYADDSSWSYTLPFDFPFYGEYYETICISSNGLITFRSSDSSFSNSIPALSSKLAIAPAWDDWEIYAPHDIYMWQNSTHVGIRWEATSHYNPSVVASFEAVLVVNGVIQFDYGYTSGPVSATIGISNGAGHTLAEDVVNLNYIRTIVFAPFPLKNDVALVSVAPSASQVPVGNTVDVNVVAENRGNATENFTVTAYASSHNSTKIYLDPSNYTFETVTVGTLFNVTVKVDGVDDMKAWQVKMGFNDSIINVTRWYEPTWDPTYVFYGKSTLPIPTPPTPGYHPGWCGVGVAIFPSPSPGEGFSGKGLLCIFTFNITATPSTGQNYACDFNITYPTSTFWIKTGESSKKQFDIYENGYYWLGPAAPPLPPPSTYEIGTIVVINLAPNTRVILTFTWNTSGVTPKDYTIWAKASVVQGETDTADNTYVDGIVTVEKPPSASFTHSPQFPKPGEIITFNATSSTPDGGIITSYEWNFGDGNTTTTADPIIAHAYAFSSIYSVTLTITDSEGLTGSISRTIYVMTRDLAVVDVTPSTDHVYVGRTVIVNVTVANKGEVNETFDLIVYYNITAGDTIGTQTAKDMLPGEQRTVTFLWDTTSVKPSSIYNLTAYAVPVYGETSVADNTLSSPIPVKVKLTGDINGDGTVDMADIGIGVEAFLSYPEHSHWNSDADINNDSSIDMVDISIAIDHFMQT